MDRLLQSRNRRAVRNPATPRIRSTDPTIRTLAQLFDRHPAWVRAAAYITEGAESAVSFSHLPGRHWRLVRRGGKSLLLRGRARDPDFAFRFTPAAVARLAAVKGGVGDFAVELFARILEPREEQCVGFRVIAPFSRLARRGYVRLLLAAGSKVMRFGAARGVRTLRDLRGLVAEDRAGRPSVRRRAQMSRSASPRRAGRRGSRIRAVGPLCC